MTSINDDSRDASHACDSLSGSRVHDELELLNILGTGAWGRVYRARHLPLGQDVAVKVLHSHLLCDRQIILRFEREARSLFSIRHPNICEVFSQGVLSSGQPFLAMEYLKGDNLATILRRETTLSTTVAIDLFLQCAAGLAAAHSRGIVHRDIKPANIFICKEPPVVKLLDFGMAKIIGEQSDQTWTGPGFGTVHYMSPEQIQGDAVDERSDIYSLGCVMYEVLSGRKVFDARSAFQIMEQHIRTVPQPLSVATELEEVVQQALEKDRSRRFRTIDELSVKLSSIALLNQ